MNDSNIQQASVTTLRKLPEGFALLSGAHRAFEQGACLLEAVAFMANEPHSDKPACTCEVLATFGRRLNDSIKGDNADALRTELLIPLAPRLIGTLVNRDIQRQRSYIAVDWAVREVAPLYLDKSPELAAHAAAMRALAPITDAATLAAARSVGVKARDAARELRANKFAAIRKLFPAYAYAAAYAAYAYADAAYADAAYADAYADAYAYAAYADAAYAAAYADAYAYAADAAARKEIRARVLAELRPTAELVWRSGAACLERMIACGNEAL